MSPAPRMSSVATGLWIRSVCPTRRPKAMLSTTDTTTPGQNQAKSAQIIAKISQGFAEIVDGHLATARPEDRFKAAHDAIDILVRHAGPDGQAR